VAVNKAQIVNRLAAVHGYRHYLELCTRSTGRQYAEIDRSLLTTCKRLMYRCPDGPGDGMEVDYRSSDLDIAECLSAIRRENQDLRHRADRSLPRIRDLAARYR
jgi:hypothetical protein